MLRHEPQPGRLLAGLVLITAAVLYTGDAVSAWSIPWWVLFPLVCGGLWLAAAVGCSATCSAGGAAAGRAKRSRGADVPMIPDLPTDLVRLAPVAVRQRLLPLTGQGGADLAVGGRGAFE